MDQVENVGINMRQYQIYKVTWCKISKASPKTYRNYSYKEDF